MNLFINKKEKRKFKLLPAFLLIPVIITAWGSKKDKPNPKETQVPSDKKEDFNNFSSEQDEILMDAINNSSSLNINYTKHIDDDLNEEILFELQDVNEKYKYLYDEKLSIENDRYNNITNSIDDMKIEYPFSDIYAVEKAYDKYKNMSLYFGDVEESKYSFYKNGLIDADELYKVVIKNNELYRNSRALNAIYREHDKSYIKEICESVCKAANAKLSNNLLDSNLDDFLENLNDLKIFNVNTLVNASVSDDNVLSVSPEGIATMEGLTNVENSFDVIIAHETEHLMQKLSSKTREMQNLKRGYGFSVEFDDLDVNSLYFNWLIEASAEEMATNLYDVPTMTYKTKVGYLRTLKYISMLNNKNNVSDVELSTQQQSMNRIFEIFDCKTEEQKIELLKLLETINIIQEDDEAFLKIYQERYNDGNKLNDEQTSEMKVKIKNAACSTMSKYFYKNLLLKVKEGNINLHDTFRLISIFENDLSKHISYAIDGNYESREIFIENYVYMQELFFDGIANKLGVERSVITDLYRKYYLDVEVLKQSIFNPVEYETFEITTYSDEKNKYFNDFFEYTINDKSESVEEVKLKNR